MLTDPAFQYGLAGAALICLYQALKLVGATMLNKVCPIRDDLEKCNFDPAINSKFDALITATNANGEKLDAINRSIAIVLDRTVGLR